MRLWAVLSGPPGTPPPTGAMCSLSGGSGSVSRNGDPFVDSARLPLRDQKSVGALSSVLRNEVAQRDDLWFRQSGTNHPHLCTRVRNVTLRTGPGRRETARWQPRKEGAAERALSPPDRLQHRDSMMPWGHYN